MVLLLFGDQVNALMPLNIDSQRLILVVGLAWLLYQVHMDHALAPRAFDIEAESEMLGAPPIRLGAAADVTVARPP